MRKFKPAATAVLAALIMSMCVSTPAQLAESEDASSGSETSVTDLVQTGSGYDSASKSYYVTLQWTGESKYYLVWQLDAVGNAVAQLGGVITPDEPKPGKRKMSINALKAGVSCAFRILGCDEQGNPLSDTDPGAEIYDVRTLPRKASKLKISGCYYNLNEIDFSWKNDTHADGWQVVVQSKSGKKTLKKATVKTSSYSLKSIRKGQVVRVRVRPYIKVNGKKKYATKWSSPVYYALAKKVKLSGYRNRITIKGLKVSGTVKKVIYISKKKKSGYVKAKTTKKSTCKITEFGKKQVISDKTYYVRIYYYYKVGGKTKKSPVYDEGSVYTKPTYFYYS